MNAPVRPPANAPPEWRLDELYSGRDDPRIEADLAEAAKLNGELAALKGRFVAARGEPAKLGALIERGMALYEAGTNKLWNVGAYAGLAASTARDDPAWSRFEADVRAKGARIGADSLFFSLELNELDDAEIGAALGAHPAAARWRPWLRRVRLGRPHELSHDLEKLLLDRAPAIANWVRLYDETLAKLSVRAGRDRLTLSEALNRMSDPDGARRKSAAQGLARALEANASTLTLAFNTLAFEKQVEDRWRRYATPAASRHVANEVDAAAVATMESAVVASYPRLSHRYYALKAKVMGKPRLEYWDRNAPLSTSQPRRYGWAEAQGIVLEAYAGLAPRFASAAERFFDRPWIDAAPRPGKQSGAYSHPVTSEKHPYVFMNFMGERRDVLTLAHELGHAVHQTLAAPRGTLLADTPLTLAETASIFGEGLVFERLLADASGPERPDLLAGKIEDALNTVVRQIAFHRFETRFHDARRRGELSTGEIGALFVEAMGESLGPAIRLGPGYETYWSYVSHFVHSPFYVYAYAFGNLLVEALMEARRRDPEGFTPLYEDLLAAGGTRTYVEALAPFGLDPREPSFWRSGCARLERLVDAFEALV
ncbi:MAG TPA: M3 family oligoendopeptidase [Caulobacteraceae bacterium]|nr:M3 family oligoendopeptidase [Caulobacteraceae bacterium]